MSTHTIRLHRVIRSTPEKIYRAFLDADAMAKWLPPNGFTCKVHHLDAKVGGTYKMSFTNFTTGKSHSFGGTDRKSTRLNSSHTVISYAVFCLKKKKNKHTQSLLSFRAC